MVRKAKIKDVDQIINLINFYAVKSEMLPRSRSHIYNSIRDFNVVEENDRIIACGALHVVWFDIAEIRAVAVDPEHKGMGIGRQLIDFMIQDANDLDLPQVFALTYKPGFFEKMGFAVVDKGQLPQKVWKDCLNCPKFPDCDEIAMLRRLKPAV